MHKISVVLIEDHDLTRIGLQSALHQQSNIEVIGEARTGAQGLEILQQMEPDVAIVDIGLPNIDGIEVTRRFKQSQSQASANGSGQTRVLMLTMHDGEEEVLAAFAAGADSYSIKDASIEKLIEAIKVTHSGENWIDPSIARIVLRQAQQDQLGAAFEESEGTRTTSISALAPEYEQVMKTCALTERELEVLELIVAGCSNADIAKELYVTVGTVKTHVRSILNKLCVGDRTQAAVRALRAGLIR
ncbi:MAG: response regulator [Elainellaceae cyanobacterium]